MDTGVPYPRQNIDRLLMRAALGGVKIISLTPPSQGVRAAGQRKLESALQITRHEKITGGPDRPNTGEGEKAGNGLPLTGSMAESVSLQTGSLRESSPQGPGESSSAFVSQGLTMVLVPTAVEPQAQGVQAY